MGERELLDEVVVQALESVARIPVSTWFVAERARVTIPEARAALDRLVDAGRVKATTAGLPAGWEVTSRPAASEVSEVRAAAAKAETDRVRRSFGSARALRPDAPLSWPRRLAGGDAEDDAIRLGLLRPVLRGWSTVPADEFDGWSVLAAAEREETLDGVEEDLVSARRLREDLRAQRRSEEATVELRARAVRLAVLRAARAAVLPEFDPNVRGGRSVELPLEVVEWLAGVAGVTVDG